MYQAKTLVVLESLMGITLEAGEGEEHHYGGPSQQVWKRSAGKYANKPWSRGRGIERADERAREAAARTTKEAEHKQIADAHAEESRKAEIARKAQPRQNPRFHRHFRGGGGAEGRFSPVWRGMPSPR